MSTYVALADALDLLAEIVLDPEHLQQHLVKVDSLPSVIPQRPQA